MTETAGNKEKHRDIRFVLKDLLKVIKVVSTYPINNPLPNRLKKEFSDKLLAIVHKHGGFLIDVRKDALLCEGETVYKEVEVKENLARIFFETGVNDVSFNADLTEAGVYRLLDVFKEYLNATSHQKDLAALIWEADIKGVRLQTIEDVALSTYDQFDFQEYVSDQQAGHLNVSSKDYDYNQLFNTGYEENEIDFDNHDDHGESSGNDDLFYSGSEEDAGDEEFAGDGEGDVEGNDKDSGGTVSSIAHIELDDEDDDIPAGIESLDLVDSFDPGDRDLKGAGVVVGSAGKSGIARRVGKVEVGVIFTSEEELSEEDRQQVQRLLNEIRTFDHFDSTIELLRELLHQEIDPQGFSETITIIEKIISTFVSEGHLLEASRLLTVLREYENHLRPEQTTWRERLQDAYLTTGSRDSLKLLAKAMNNNPELGAIELKRYLDNFDWKALSGITDLLGDFEHRLHRETLCDYLANSGQEKIDILAKGMFDKRWFVVRNTVGILGRIGTDKAINYIHKAVKHEMLQVRQEIVNVLKTNPSGRSLEILMEMIHDPDPDISRQVIDNIVSRRGRDAFDTITNILNDPSFTTLSENEQLNILKAYSALGGEAALEYLNGLIIRYNTFRDKSIAFLRDAAFEALADNRSGKAVELLQSLAGSWRTGIKKKALEIIERRNEYVYGGRNER